MHRTLALLLVLTAGPLAAQTPLSAEEFDTWATGRTLTFAIGDEPYGIERYHPGRRVTWAFLGQPCMEGEWYPQDDAICFVYDEGTDTPSAPQCWQLFREGDALRARFVSDPDNRLDYQVREAEIPLICPGPGV